MKFTHIRHASHLIDYKGITLLIDPVLATKGTYQPIPAKGRCQKNPLVELPFNLDFLKNVDAILVTHLHNDHFDKYGQKIIDKDLPIICHSCDAEKIKNVGFKNVLPINDDFILFKEIKISVTSGRHGYGLTAKAMGHVSGFVLEDLSQVNWEPKVYIIGDSVWTKEIEKTLKFHQPDLIIVFAGEARLGRAKPITMSTYDIDQIATTLIDARIIVIHLEAWNHCYLTKKTLTAYLDTKSYQDRVLIPENGEVLSFT